MEKKGFNDSNYFTFFQNEDLVNNISSNMEYLHTLSGMVKNVRVTDDTKRFDVSNFPGYLSEYTFFFGHPR